MPADDRIKKLLSFVDEMLMILDDIQADMQNNVDIEKNKENMDEHKIAFYQSQKKRASNLAALLEEDVITNLIGLSNLSGPIKYLKEEEK